VSVGKSALARRRNDYGKGALAARVAHLGLLDEHLKDAIMTHVTAMKTAVNRYGIDWAARQRSADALLALGEVVAGLGGGLRGDERPPLLALTIVQQAPGQIADVIEADPLK